ncbi:MAG: DUF11 domain-containing protein [Pseudomonadota bacterium]
MMISSLSLLAPKALADLGEEVVNIATITYGIDGDQIEFRTNEASFVIQARATPSTVEFFRDAPSAPDGQLTAINGTDFSPSGSFEGPFQDINTTSGQSKTGLKFPASLNLVPAEIYLAGETIVVRVTDIGQNGDPNTIETVIASIVTESGDQIVLRLYEDQPASGQFYAVIPSSPEPTKVNDGVLTAPQKESLTATYIDAFDATEISIDTATIDPTGRVFNSFTGGLLDGIEITLIDAATGLPAEVKGIDGIASFPSTIVTGETQQDTIGISYKVASGEFLFPSVQPGTYRLLVMEPPEFSYPSARAESDFETLPNAPFKITEASYSNAFTVETTGPISLDIPLDPTGELFLAKTADVSTASEGDFVRYSIELDNRNTTSTSFKVSDTLPYAFRYVPDSARYDGQPIANPVISENGRNLLFPLTFISSLGRSKLTYLTVIGPDSQPGEAVNTAVALNNSGNTLSNFAEAAITIEEDLLTSRLTIIGRVAEAACKPEDDWARTIKAGRGVAGVRLYMEDGRYTVTDEQGLYHFEGIEPGTRIVQVDRATLPKGYDPVLCEENTRFAGSAISQFVDAQGGSLWRANFYLQRNGEAIEEDELQTEELSFDRAWLDQQPADTVGWAYPREGETPKGRSVDLALLHGPDQGVELSLNGRPVKGLNFNGRRLSSGRDVALSSWSGVDIERGRNVFEAKITSKEGEVLSTQRRDIWFIDTPARARVVDDQSILVANGLTKPVIAVRLEDAAGQAVHEGRLVEISIADPYRLASTAEEEFEDPIAAPLSTVSATPVGQGGIAYVELEPTLQAGRVRLNVELANGLVEELDIWLKPEKRDWVLVGLAEAEGLLSNSDGPEGRNAEELMTDGRLAFFAKGVIKGDWLLTVAIDTAKRRGDADGELFDEIDPNAYYTLYGDRTWQYNDAESRYPVYVKLERQSFQALFGDYETDLQETELGRYSRRLSGFKTDYESEHLSVTAFAAETNQRFARDELAADGTSGPFELSADNILRGSETLIVETRDRLRPDQILSTRPLTRYVDYEIDYITGELFFRLPVPATDQNFNTNVIVVDYETSDPVDRGLTAGGRAAVRFADERIETGVTIIHEDDGASAETDASQLYALDTTIRVSSALELRAEVAQSDSDTDEGRRDGTAVLFEGLYRLGKTGVTGYYREETEGFGLGQQSSNTAATRRYGIDLIRELSTKDSQTGQNRSVRSIEARAYREENLTQKAERTVADISLRQDSQILSANVGLRAVDENYEQTDENRQSLQLLGGAQKYFESLDLTLTVQHEQPISVNGGDGDEATLFPQRTVLGVDKALGDRATLTVRHDITEGENASGENTFAGITWQPTAGTLLSASSDTVLNENGRRLGATVGVDQTWRVTDAWSLSAGAVNRTRINAGDEPLDVTPDAAFGPLEDGVRSPLTEDDGFTSAYVGTAYRTPVMAVSGRAEVRDSTRGDRFVGTVGGARSVSDKLSFSLAARYQNESESGQDRTEFDARIAAAYRPKGEGLVVLNRFDVGTDEVRGESERLKLVNNMTLNARVTDQLQTSVWSGVKYVKADFSDDVSSSGYTWLLGGEARYDVTPKIDLGIHATRTSGEASKTAEWAVGPSIGYSPRQNVWISLGWNFEGFEDEDFEAAEYASDGPFIKFRAKFDQDTVRGMIRSLGLGAE